MDIDKVFKALADPTRRRLLDLLRADNGQTRLTVTHDELDPQMLAGISRGWPAARSNLKTLLETGRLLHSRKR